MFCYIKKIICFCCMSSVAYGATEPIVRTQRATSLGAYSGIAKGMIVAPKVGEPISHSGATTVVMHHKRKKSENRQLQGSQFMLSQLDFMEPLVKKSFLRKFFNSGVDEIKDFYESLVNFGYPAHRLVTLIDALTVSLLNEDAFFDNRQENCRRLEEVIYWLKDKKYYIYTGSVNVTHVAPVVDKLQQLAPTKHMPNLSSGTITSFTERELSHHKDWKDSVDEICRRLMHPWPETPEFFKGDVSEERMKRTIEKPLLVVENQDSEEKSSILVRAKRLFPSIKQSFQAVVVPETSKIHVIGDIHGMIDHLKAKLSALVGEGAFSAPNSFVLVNGHYLVFLGDLIDRGPGSIEVVDLVMRLKIANPASVFILRGNHEYYGMLPHEKLEEYIAHFNFFHKDIPERFPSTSKKLIEEYNALFERLPVAMFIGMRQKGDKRVTFGLYCHGGFDERGNAFNIIQRLLNAAVSRPGVMMCIVIPESVPMQTGFNWGEFFQSCPKDGKMANVRGVPGVYDYDRIGVCDILHRCETDEASVRYIIRGHRHMNGGINRLNDPEDPITNDIVPDWMTLVCEYASRIKPYAVYTLMLTDALGDMQKAYSATIRLVGDEFMIMPKETLI